MRANQNRPAQRRCQVLLLLPYEPAAFMQADMAILQRRFDLAVVVHNQGKRRLFFGMARRLLRRRPNMLVMWFVVPSYALVMTVLAKLFRLCASATATRHG